MTRVRASKKQGFSYIELLVSLFIISSGFIAYMELIIRVRSTQQHLITEFQQSLATGLSTQSVAIQQRFCKSDND